MRPVIAAYIAVFICFAHVTCTNMLSGNTSETGNAATIAGMIYEPEGKAPAAGVTVVIRGKNTLPLFDVTEPWNVPLSSDSVLTDEKGEFSFFDINQGEYVVSATRGNSGAIIEPVSVIDTEHTVYIADTLEPLGAIKGTVVFKEGGDPGNAMVLVFGINQYATVDSIGTFVLPLPAEGTYNIKVLANTPYYESLDISGISVKPGETTDIGHIELPFNAVPKPKNAKLVFDTAKYIISLQWDRCDTSKVKKYYVIKRSYLLPEGQIVDDTSTYSYSYSEDPRYSITNTDEFADTCYHDTVILDKNYFKYNIVAVDGNGNHSSFSDTISCSSTPRYYLTGQRLLAREGQDILLPYSYDEIAVSNDKVYTLWQDNIAVLDNSLNFRYHIKIKAGGYWLKPKRIAVDEFGKMFTICDDRGPEYSDEAGIFSHNRNGSISRKIVDNTIRKYGTIDIDVKNGLLYAITGGIPRDDTVAFPRYGKYMDDFYAGGDSVVVYKYGGERVNAWKCSDGSASRWLCINGHSRIFVSNGRETDQILVFDLQGNMLSTITMPDFPSKINGLKLYPQALDYDDKRNLLYVHVIAGENEHHMIFVFDDKNRYIGRFALPSLSFNSQVYSLAVLDDGSVVYLASGGYEARGYTEFYWIARLNPLF